MSMRAFLEKPSVQGILIGGFFLIATEVGTLHFGTGLAMLRPGEVARPVDGGSEPEDVCICGRKGCRPPRVRPVARSDE